MSTLSEKLVYLQNGVFKRKELSDGLQYYSDGSFNTLAIPAADGNFVFTKGDNGLLTWTDAGTVVPKQPEEFTTLDNSYFKDSNNQAITIATQGMIPYFVNNATFGKLDLPGSGKYVLSMDEDGVPSFSTFDESTIFTALDIGNPLFSDVIVKWSSITSTCSTLYLPNQSGTYILTAEDDDVLGGTSYSFSTLNATGLFHDTLSIQSTNLCLIGYKGNSAFGVNVPAMNNSSGYFVFKNEANNEVPTTSILNASTIYQDIFGCASTERCLVYNDGSSVSKLTLPTDDGKYLLNVSRNGVSITTQPTKLAIAATFQWDGSGHSVITETIPSSITLSSSSKYFLTFHIGLKCTNYEQALIGFTDDPFLTIGVKPTIGLKVYLNAATSSLHTSGSCIGSPATTGAISISVTRDGDTTITHIYTHF